MVFKTKFFPYTTQALCYSVVFYAMASLLTWGILKLKKRKGIHEAYVFCASLVAVLVLLKFSLKPFGLVFDLASAFLSINYAIIFLVIAACAIIFRFFLLKRQLNDVLALGSSFFILLIKFKIPYYSGEPFTGMLAATWYYITRIPVLPAPEEKETQHTQ
jgi:hypothetical protein